MAIDVNTATRRTKRKHKQSVVDQHTAALVGMAERRTPQQAAVAGVATWVACTIAGAILAASVLARVPGLGFGASLGVFALAVTLVFGPLAYLSLRNPDHVIAKTTVVRGPALSAASIMHCVFLVVLVVASVGHFFYSTRALSVSDVYWPAHAAGNEEALIKVINALRHDNSECASLAEESSGTWLGGGPDPDGVTRYAVQCHGSHMDVALRFAIPDLAGQSSLTFPVEFDTKRLLSECDRHIHELAPRYGFLANTIDFENSRLNPVMAVYENGLNADIYALVTRLVSAKSDQGRQTQVPVYCRGTPGGDAEVIKWGRSMTSP